VRTLQREGFAGATSRAVARNGGFNPALIFYYFGSLDGLLLAALEQTSTARLTRYREALEDVTTVDRLLEVMVSLYSEDRDSGHITVVSQMMAGSLANPELRPQVLTRMEPWIDLAEATIARLLPPLLPARDLGAAAVTFYLGANLLSALQPENTQLERLFEHAMQLAPLLARLSGERA
jgi:AcrR family transcriptional regulator